MSYSEKSDTGVYGACTVEGSIPSTLFDLNGRRAYSSKLCFGGESQPLSHSRAVIGGNSFLEVKINLSVGLSDFPTDNRDRRY